MIRFFFVLLAVIAAILAVLMDSAWLYMAAGAALAVAVALLVRGVLRTHRKKEQPYDSGRRSHEDELGALGISKIREKSSSVDAQEAKGDRVEARPSPVGKPMPANRAGTEAEPSLPSANEEVPPADEGDGPTTQGERAPAWPEDGGAEDVLPPYLTALRAALEAHTVCLLAQEELALEYRVEAAAGPAAYIGRGETFTTQAPLLTAGMSQQGATLKAVGPPALEAERLGYYAGEVPALRHVAFAPVPRSGLPTTWFLVADANSESFARRHSTRTLLTRFADLLALVMDIEASDEDELLASVERVTGTAPSENGAQHETEAPRPRREIIAEEMERAQAEGRPLALALVYLNRAEAIAQRGAEAVEAAEEALRARLEAAVPRARVEPFGELTYGLFYDGDVDEVEAWAVQVETDLAGAKAPLEGGISIGLAVMHERHLQHPEALRADATEALREAYQTGTCTILG